MIEVTVDVVAIRTPTGWMLEAYTSYSTTQEPRSYGLSMSRFPTLDDAWRHASRTYRGRLERFIVAGGQ